MCCMQKKSNSKWLFTCRTLEVMMTTSHTTDVHYIKYIYMYIYIDNICKRDSSGDKWRFFRWSPCCWLTTAVIHTCPAYTATPRCSAGHCTKTWSTYKCWGSHTVFSCRFLFIPPVKGCPLVSQFPSEPHFPSAVSLELCSNKSQTTWVCLLLFLCPLLNSGYRQSSWYRKHFQHIWVLTGSKPFRSSMTTVCWSPRAVSAAGAWWQQCQRMSCPACCKCESISTAVKSGKCKTEDGSSNRIFCVSSVTG